MTDSPRLYAIGDIHGHQRELLGLITARRLWGAWDDPAPLIRVMIEVPPDRWWALRMVATEASELQVGDDWETLSGRERYEAVRDHVLGKVAVRAGLPDRFVEGKRKQPRRV